jgi:hypothetical protein
MMSFNFTLDMIFFSVDFLFKNKTSLRFSIIKIKCFNMKCLKKNGCFAFACFFCFHLLGQNTSTISSTAENNLNRRQILRILERDENASTFVLSPSKNKKGVVLKNRLDIVQFTPPDNPGLVAIVCRGQGIKFAKCVNEWFKKNPSSCLIVKVDGQGDFTADDDCK